MFLQPNALHKLLLLLRPGSLRLPGRSNKHWNEQYPAMTWLRHVLKAICSGFNQSLE